MRVIAGTRKSRKLYAPPGEKTRPTHDRVKEALFSILGDVSGKSVVDLYAGTGALGIEALSRGAKHACFVERARAPLECIRRNLEELKLADQSTVLPKSVASVAPDLLRLGPHDLVFCDPPWAHIADVLVLLDELDPTSWLTADGRLVVEHPSKFDAALHPLKGMVVTKTRAWGDTAVTFFEGVPTGVELRDPDPT